MSTRRAVAWGVAGIGVAFAASLLVILRLESLPDERAAAAPPPPAADPPAPVAPAPVLPPPAPAQAAASEAVVPEPVEQVVLVRRSAPATPPARAEVARFQQGVPPARRKVLSSMRAELIAGLETLQQRVAPCGASDIAFLLTLQSEEDGVHVVEAAVGSPEPGQESAIGCARTAVVGQVMPGSSVEPGKRWQMSFTPAN